MTLYTSLTLEARPKEYQKLTNAQNKATLKQVIHSFKRKSLSN